MESHGVVAPYQQAGFAPESVLPRAAAVASAASNGATGGGDAMSDAEDAPSFPPLHAVPMRVDSDGGLGGEECKLVMDTS